MFVRRCEISANFGATVSIIAPLDAATSFVDWRRKIHDAVDHRRGVDRQWRAFGLIARFDRNCIRGVAHIAHLGTDAFHELIGACEITPIENLDAQTVAQSLMTGPFIPLPGSLKNLFATVNPKPCRHGAYARTGGGIHREPMPTIF